METLAKETRDVAGAAVEVLDRDVDVLGVGDRRIVGSRRVEVASQKCSDFAREADHREQIDAVHRRRHVEHLVADRKHVDERRSGLGAVGEHHDPGVVVSEADLVLGQDHPAGRLAAELALVQRLIEDRQECAGQRDGDGRPGLEVPGAADDLARISLPHVDLAHAQPVGVRVRVDREHTAHEEAADVAVDVRHPDVDNALDLERRDGESVRDLVGGRVDRDVLAEPGEGSAHQNCPRSRGSLRQSSRRSGIPWRRTAIRSSPQPNAKPV